jgi:superfamily II DNA or RNA helicase
VDFDSGHEGLPIPPYILGVWLGDGLAKQPSISKPKGVVIEEYYKYANSIDCQIGVYDNMVDCPSFRITNNGRRAVNGQLERSIFHKHLESLGVLGNKHIPKSYIMASKEDRLNLLAGLLDTDGHLCHGGYDFIQKSEQIAKAVVFICRSLGLAAYTNKQTKRIKSTGFEGQYWRVGISGDCSMIPCRDPKKKATARQQKKRHLVTGLNILYIGEGEYFGFEIDGDKQFLLGDWQVTHNTEMGFEIIRGAQAKGRKVAFVANRVQLVDQTCRRLSQAGFEYGVIQGQNTHSPWRSVLVCSIQTLLRRGCPEDIALLVIDEAHSAAGTKAYHEIMKGRPVIGLTATPYSKGLGRHYPSLGGPLFEKVVVAALIKDLIRDGFLVDAEVWAPAEPDLSGVKIVAGDYNEKQLGEAVDKGTLIGDIVTHWFKIANNTSTVVFATNISHSKHIVEQFIGAGVRAEHLDCYTTDDERLAILDRVSRGETRVISNVGVLAEGWDFPACETLILARPTKSLIRYLQMAGRILRPYPGKHARILDHSGVVRRLGFPWDCFAQKLDDGKPKSSSDPAEKKEPLPKPCPECHFMKPPRTPKCPMCGFEAMRPDGVEVEDGELVPLTKHKKGLPALEDIGRTDVYHQLLWYANEHGYKEGWAAMKYKEAFGCWPNGITKARQPPMGTVLAWIRSRQIAWAKAQLKEKK